MYAFLHIVMVVDSSSEYALFFDRFVFKNTGVLFENDILQVGIKSEFSDTKGKSCHFVLIIIINNL